MKRFLLLIFNYEDEDNSLNILSSKNYPASFKKFRQITFYSFNTFILTQYNLLTIFSIKMLNLWM